MKLILSISLKSEMTDGQKYIARKNQATNDVKKFLYSNSILDAWNNPS